MGLCERKNIIWELVMKPVTAVFPETLILSYNSSSEKLTDEIIPLIFIGCPLGTEMMKLVQV